MKIILVVLCYGVALGPHNSLPWKSDSKPNHIKKGVERRPTPTQHISRKSTWLPKGTEGERVTRLGQQTLSEWNCLVQEYHYYLELHKRDYRFEKQMRHSAHYINNAAKAKNTAVEIIDLGFAADHLRRARSILREKR